MSAYSYHLDYSTSLPPSLDLRGKYAIVTGATRGIGHQIALIFASRGIHVAMVYTSASFAPAAEEIVDKVKGLGRKCCAI